MEDACPGVADATWLPRFGVLGEGHVEERLGGKVQSTLCHRVSSVGASMNIVYAFELERAV